MKLFLIAIGIALELLGSGPVRAATMLSDTELVGVSGGGADPNLGGQSLPQNQQQPGSNTSGYTPRQQLPINDGMELAPELFAVLQSTIEAQRERNVHLDGTTQQNAMALNLENLLSSDSVATNNIFDGSSLSLGTAAAEVEINQANNLEQLHRSQGSLTSSIAGHQYETTVESHSGSGNYLYYSYSLVDHQLRRDQVRTDAGSSHVSVGVGINSLGQVTANTLPISIIPATDYGPYFNFTAKAMVDGLIGDKYGAALEYSGTKLTGVGLTLNRIETQASDLVLGTILTLPTLDLGTIKATGCVGVCIEGSVPFGSMGGQAFPNDIVIPGLGPRIDELNLGTGFAVIGSSGVHLRPASFNISGKAAVKVTPNARATLDLSKVKVGDVAVGTVIKDILGQNKWTTSLQFDLINLDVPFTLVDLKGDRDPFDRQVDGSIFYGDNATGNTNHAATEILDQDNDTKQVSVKVDDAKSSFSSAYEHSVFTGGLMTGAEAELLALSDGTLAVSNISNVTLAEGAQKSMRVFNGVNAASSVAANALNLSRLPALGATGILMTQQNRFNQQK